MIWVGAKMEMDGGGATKAKHSILKELGDIDVYVWNENNETWELQGGFHETGPIAFNHQILPLKTRVTGDDLKLKIVLNKGLWRIDFMGLANIKQQVEPLEITPDNILIEGCENAEALANIATPDKYLISMPGDVYKFNFSLPENQTDYELFLFSKGYYLEWIRDSWIKEKNLLKLAQMRTTPKMYLKAEAAAYKAYEVDMEEQFWNSKIDTKTFSPNYVPSTKNVGIERHGSRIIIKPFDGEKIKGEFIAIDEEMFVVLEDYTGSMVSAPRGNIKKIKIRYAQPKQYGWAIPVFIVSTISHGGFLILTAPLNAGVTSGVTATGVFDFTYNNRRISDMKIQRFARFPQGIPEGVELTDIARGSFQK